MIVFLGRRWVFLLILFCYILALGLGATFLYHEHAATKLTNGNIAAFGLAAVGLGIMVLVQIFMALLLFIRLHAADRTRWWILPTLVPFAGIPFFLVGLLGDGDYSFQNDAFGRTGTTEQYKPMAGLVLALLCSGTLFFMTDLRLVFHPTAQTRANTTTLYITPPPYTPARSSMGIPIPSTRVSCYDPTMVNTVGQHGWVGNCGGLLIVDNTLLRRAASRNVGGTGTFELKGPDGNLYTFAKSKHTIFTGQVTNFSALFYNTSFNSDISHWNTENAVDMSFMFAFNTAFDHNIETWDTSNVLNMSGMFESAESFNNNVGPWSVSLWYAQRRNKTLEQWNVSKVKNMRRMFANARSFNQPLEAWDISSAENLSQMFSNASSFSQELTTWETSNVTNMAGMFEYAATFNSNIQGWDISNTVDTSYMFRSALSFDQPINTWNTQRVNTMSGMFTNAAAFNHPLSEWNLSSVTLTNAMFAGASSFDQDIQRWDMSSVLDMSYMFSGATAFNQPIGGWNVSEVIDMNGLFLNAERFNQDLSRWNTEQVTSMDSMFENASAFDQDVSSWITSVAQQPLRFSTGSHQNFQSNDTRKPKLLGLEGPGSGEHFSS